MGIVIYPFAMKALTRSLSFFSLVAVTACGGHVHPVVAPAPLPREVFLEIEVYDPVTNFVWEGVDVRIVEGALEWSGLTIRNPDPNAWYVTDSFGTVLFDPIDVADARIGFVEDNFGNALLEPDFDRDEAWVLVEVHAPGFPTVLMDVQLTWDANDVFISIPFGV